jgi:prevent-host-death family protein
MYHTGKEISVREARDHMSSILNHVAFGGKRYTLTRHGRGIAVIVSIEEWQAIEQLLQKAEDEEDIRDAEAALERVEQGGPIIPHEEVMRKLGLED